MIARHRSMTRPAEKLRVSQSTLSKHLAELETWRGRQLHLTEAGRLALEHAKTIFPAAMN
jgi:LysR family transcriptional activator of nhaA